MLELDSVIWWMTLSTNEHKELLNGNSWQGPIEERRKRMVGLYQESHRGR